MKEEREMKSSECGWGDTHSAPAYTLTCAIIPSSSAAATASADRLVELRKAHVKEILENGEESSDSDIFKGGGDTQLARCDWPSCTEVMFFSHDHYLNLQVELE